MSTITVEVPDLDDGPVVIRTPLIEPFELTAKDGKIRCTPEQLPAVQAAFATTTVVAPKSAREEN